MSEQCADVALRLVSRPIASAPSTRFRTSGWRFHANYHAKARWLTPQEISARSSVTNQTLRVGPACLVHARFPAFSPYVAPVTCCRIADLGCNHSFFGSRGPASICGLRLRLRLRLRP